ncbi:alpha/beta hydrolase [Rhodoluna sp.]|uniref:alpha/beta fold hydrolase n=1 Tax=Rhodoluna sp. TaxID=1969481 RepID=UPI0025F2CC31|nr:alpha/beta hydrolase [Rhodoluna sp.]
MTELPLTRSFKDAQGIDITFYEWPVAHPKGVVQLVHGLGEHARRYDHVAEALNRAGFSVYADDHRGHGVTGQRMTAEGITKKQGNLGPGGMAAVFAGTRALSHLIVGENPEAPLVLIGHSWGSMVSQRLFNKYSDEYDGLVLSGSTLLLPGVLPSSGFNKKWDKTENSSGYEWLSRDAEVGRGFLADPKNFPETAIQAFGITNVLQLLGTPSKSIDSHVPVLLMAGSDDPLGGERGNKLLLDAYRRAGVQDTECVIYHDARHEIFNETNKTEVLADLVKWLNDRLNPTQHLDEV